MANPDIPQEYEIKTHTGDVFGAGTAANVFIVLIHSATKETGVFFLDDKDWVKKDASVRFQVCLDVRSITFAPQARFCGFSSAVRRSLCPIRSWLSCAGLSVL